MSSAKENDSIARMAVNALIEDAKAEFKGKRKEAFVWGIYHALRVTDPMQLQKLRELLQEHGIQINPSETPKSDWVN